MKEFSSEELFDDDLLSTRRSNRGAQEVVLYPIIDMMATIIIFLILSASFEVLTKHTLPPSGVSTVTSANFIVPVQPVLLLSEREKEIFLELSWGGDTPSSLKESISADELTSDNSGGVVAAKTRKMVTEFLKMFPSEKTLQVGLSSDSRYQFLISAMDGAQPEMSDVVLVDYFSVDARMQK